MVLTAICTLGAFLRLHNLGSAGLWVDEITFVNESSPTTSLFDIGGTMLGSYHRQHQPALPRMMESVWLRAAKRLGLALDETTYRLPAAAMGTASIGVMFLLARRMFDERTGALAALLLSISFLHVYYSREAYNYAPFFLCALLSWYFLVRLLERFRHDARLPVRDLVCYGVTTALTLHMMMAGILFVFTEFLCILLAAWSRSARKLPMPARSRKLTPLVIAHVAAWVPFAPFLAALWHYESADAGAKQVTGMVPFVKMLGEMGWSSRPLPLALFLAFVSLGIWFSLRDERWHDSGVLCLVLGVFGAIGVGYLEKMGRYETRYFLALLPSLLLWAAVAMARLGSLVAARRGTLAAAAGGVLLGALFLWFHAPLYQQLFQLKGKLLHGRAIAEWINQNTPPGAVYFTDRLYLLREVPQFYATPGRFGIFAGVPSSPAGQAADDQRLSEFYRGLMRRLPDIYFITTQQERNEQASREWWNTLFRRHVRIENPPLARLRGMGIFPSGAFMQSGSEAIAAEIHYNTVEDMVELKRMSGENALALFGTEWVVSTIPSARSDAEFWKGLHSAGTIVVHGLRDTAFRARLILHCGSYGTSQTILIGFQGKESSQVVEGDRFVQLDLGEFPLLPGRNEFSIRKTKPQSRDELPNFLVYEIEAGQRVD